MFYKDVENLDELKRGDIIIHKRDRSKSYVVCSNYGDRITAVVTADVTNPSEWQVLREDEKNDHWAV